MRERAMTIFGDKREFALAIEPLNPAWERRSLADRGPWACVSIFVQQKCLTQGHDPATGASIDGVNVPLFPIAALCANNR